MKNRVHLDVWLPGTGGRAAGRARGDGCCGRPTRTSTGGWSPTRRGTSSARSRRCRDRLRRLDLAASGAELTAALVDVAVGVRRRGPAGRRGRGRAAGGRRPGGGPRRRHRAGPHRARPAAPGGARRAPRHRADRRQRAVAVCDGDRLLRLRHLGHEVRRRRAAAAGRRWPRRRAGDDLTLVFYDNEEVEAAQQRPRPGGPRAAPTGWPPTSRSCWSRPTAQVEAGCQGTLRAAVDDRAAGARTAPGPGSASTRSTRAAPVLARLAAYEPREVDIDGCALPRGAQRGRHRRRRGRQRDPRRVPRSRSTSASPPTGPTRTPPRRTCARCSPGSTRRCSVVDSAPGALPGLAAPAAAALRRRGRQPSRWPSRLDRRRPVRRASASRR